MSYTPINTFVPGNLIVAAEVNANFLQAATEISDTSGGHEHDGVDSKQLTWGSVWADPVHTHWIDTEGGIGPFQAMLPLSELLFRLIDASTFPNRDFLVCDSFTTTTGKNGTVNTGSTTATYTTSGLGYSLRPQGVKSGDTTNDPNSFSNPTNAFDENDTTYANKSETVSSGAQAFSRYLGKTWTENRYIGYVYVKSQISLTGSGSVYADIQYYNGSTWATANSIWGGSGPLDTTDTRYVWVGKTCKGVRVQFFLNRNDDDSPTLNNYLYTLNYSNYEQNKTILCNTGTVTLVGDEKAITVYGRQEGREYSTTTYDVSDGTTTISDVPINTVASMETLGTGTLTLTFNLSTADTKNSVLFKGFGAGMG